MVFACPPLCSCLNACARSAPLANPLTRSGVSRTIIRPQTLAVCRPPFRYVRALRLRVLGAAQPGGPQRPSPLTPRILPSQEPRRQNGATAETATNPRPGSPCAPPSPLPHSAPFRSPDHQRQLVRPAANALNEPIPAVRDSDPRFRACRARCSPSAADSPGLNDFGPPLADSLRPTSCAGRL
jgi:hypothetical protein